MATVWTVFQNVHVNRARAPPNRSGPSPEPPTAWTEATVPAAATAGDLARFFVAYDFVRLCVFVLLYWFGLLLC